MMTGEIRNYRNLTRNSGWWRYLRIALLTILIWMGTSGGVPAWGRWISPSEAAFWAALFPGGGHFYLHEHKKGAALAATEFSFLGGGIYLDVSRDNCSLTDYNPLYLLAMKEHELSIFLAFREARKAIDDYGFDTPRDDSSVARIIASGTTPWTGSTVVIADFDECFVEGRLARKPTAEGGRCTMRFLDEAITDVRAGRTDALVTGPITKNLLHQAGYPFVGQTELLAHLSRTKKFAMLLSTPLWERPSGRDRPGSQPSQTPARARRNPTHPACIGRRSRARGCRSG
jgi:hypothetical protein